MHAQLVSFIFFIFLVLLFFDCLYKNFRCLFIQNCMHIIQSIYLILYMCLPPPSPPFCIHTQYNSPSFVFPPWFALRFSTFSSTRKTTKSNEQLQILLCTISDWLRGRCYNRWAWRKWSEGGGEGRGERFGQHFVCLWVSCLTYCHKMLKCGRRFK